MKRLKTHVTLNWSRLARFPMKDGVFLFDGVIVEGDFLFSGNLVTNLEEVHGNFICHGNRVKFTEEDVRRVCKVGGFIRTAFKI